MEGGVKWRRRKRKNEQARDIEGREGVVEVCLGSLRRTED